MLQSMWEIVLELAPWLLLGAAIAGAMHALLPPDFMRRHLSGRWSVLKAAAIGVPLPLCSCSVIPVGLSLKRQGATNGATIAFLISTPQTGVDSIMVSAALLGIPFAVFKMFSALVIGTVGGLLTDIFAKEPEQVSSLPIIDPCEVRSGSRWRAFFEHALSLLRAIWGWLVVGVVASAAITYFLPPDSLVGLSEHGGVWAMVLAVLVGIPLYVCAVASVPIAAALVHGGFPLGAALVFLIAGPASNVATMGAVYRSLGRPAFVVYVLTIAVGSIACGWVFQYVLDLGGLHQLGHLQHEGHMTTSWWAIASAVILLVLLAWFAYDDLRAFLLKRRGAEPTGPEPSLEVGVEGMTCQNCASRLEKALSRADGVKSAAVSLDRRRAVVRGDISLERLREVIKGAGFEAT